MAEIEKHVSFAISAFHPADTMNAQGMDLEIFSHFMIMQQLRLLRFYPLKKALK